MDDVVTLRPVAEDDLSWLASLKNSPAGSGLRERHGWSDPQRKRGTTFRQGRWHDQVIYSVVRDEVELEDSAAEDGPV